VKVERLALIANNGRQLFGGELNNVVQIIFCSVWIVAGQLPIFRLLVREPSRQGGGCVNGSRFSGVPPGIGKAPLGETRCQSSGCRDARSEATPTASPAAFENVHEPVVSRRSMFFTHFQLLKLRIFKPSA
jgi:hypothetical protein